MLNQGDSSQTKHKADQALVDEASLEFLCQTWHKQVKSNHLFVPTPTPLGTSSTRACGCRLRTIFPTAWRESREQVAALCLLVAFLFWLVGMPREPWNQDEVQGKLRGITLYAKKRGHKLRHTGRGLLGVWFYLSGKIRSISFWSVLPGALSS